MPRIAHRVYRAARSKHPHLASLLPVCRDLRSAENELRWIRESVQSNERQRFSNREQIEIAELVRRRARGEPLQYILGSEYFGNLEIKCRLGVLIPRPETAASVTHLVSLISSYYTRQPLPSRLRVLDICTGTGCIPLLFHDEFYSSERLRNVSLDIKGFDISSRALELAYENLALQRERRENELHVDTVRRHASIRSMTFQPFDVFARDTVEEGGIVEDVASRQPRSQTMHHGVGFRDTAGDTKCDILISNPPYISPSDYRRTTARSVRRFEPKLALVPSSLAARGSGTELDERQGDTFYPRLLDLAVQLNAKIALFEVADLEQAKRVAAMALQRTDWKVEVKIWRDEPSRARSEEVEVADGKNVAVIGEGNGRSVFMWRNDCTTFAS